jgi:pimeloyl-ACP methyl ester carboxylesterase
MKKTLIYASLLLSTNLALSQNPTPVDFDELLTPLLSSDPQDIILYDRVAPLANLAHFNDSLNCARPALFEQGLSELYRASNQQEFMSVQELRNHRIADSIVQKTKIAFIHKTINSLNTVDQQHPNAAFIIQDTTLTHQNAQAPALRAFNLMMAAPLKKVVEGPEVNFVFDQDLLLGDYEDVKEIWSDLGGNVSHKIWENNHWIQPEKQVTFSTTGDYLMNFILEYQDGSLRSTQALIHVKHAATNPGVLVENGQIFAQIPWQGFNENTPYLGKLDYRIFYRTNNGNQQARLQKPIVIIDGFDPGDHRKIQDSDPHPWSTDNEHRSIEEMMHYIDAQGNRIDIIPLLRNLGYDVVVVNHPTHWHNGIQIDGGADYIERNALTHVQLYQRLLQRLDQNNSSESLVIVGPSMGGQISRYALAYMEKHGIEHRTRLWVSVDSPHLGANIPIGVQSLLHLMHDITGSVAAGDFIEGQLNSAAARQQLIEQYINSNNEEIGQSWLDGRSISQGFSQNKGRPIYLNYYNNLFHNGLTGSQGYPTLSRNIALVNGSLIGRSSFMNPFEPLSTELSGTLSQDNYINPGGQSLKIKGMANVLGQILGLETYGMPAPGQRHKIAFFKSKSLWWNYYSRYITNNNSRGPLDRVPGGWFPTTTILAESITESTPCEWVIGQVCINDWIINAIDHVNSFIPTVSALGLIDPDLNWGLAMEKNLICQNAIPFDSYFGPKDNEQHTSFTEQSVAWLLEELAGNPQRPSVYLDTDDLQGPDALCTSGPNTFWFDSCVAPEVIEWNISNNLSLVDSDPYNISVEVVNTTVQQGFIEAVFSDQSLRKTFWVGTPGASPSLVGPETVRTGSTVTYTAAEAPGATSYQWYLPYPFDIQAPFDYTSTNWQVPPDAGRNTQVFTGYGGYNGLVQVMGLNDCGAGDATIMSVIHGNNGSGQQQAPVFPYPNSSDDAFHLDFSGFTSGNFSIDLYDALGQNVYSGQSSNVHKTINTLSIDGGTYFLHISDGTEIWQFQLIIDHQ